MAKFDWSKYPIIPEAQGATSAPAKFDWSKYPIVPEPQKQALSDQQLHAMGMPEHHSRGALADFGGEMLNTAIINPANTVLDATRGLAHLLHAPALPPTWKIPSVPTEHGISSVAGALAGFALPFGEAAKGIELGAEALGLGGESLAAQRAAHIAKSGLAGGIAGEATVPSGQHGVLPAALGAAGGVVGEGIGQILRPSAQHLGKIVAAQRLLDHLKASSDLVGGEGRAPENMLDDLQEHYVNAQNKVAPKYQAIFKDLAPKGQVMQTTDMPTLQSTIGDLTKRNARLSGVIYPKDLISPSLGGIDPEEVHHAQSKMGRFADSSFDPADKAVYSKVQKGMQMDLQSFLKKHGKLAAYKKASAAHIKHLVPFRNSRAFSTNIEPHINRWWVHSLEGKGGTQFSGMDDATKSATIARKFVPTANESDLGKFHELKRMLGNNQDLAVEHTRNNIFAPYLKEGEATGTPEVKVAGFLKRYEKLSPQQRDLLFKPDEQTILKGAQTALTMPKEVAKSLPETALGMIAGHYFGGAPGAAAGLVAGRGVSEGIGKGIGRILAPKDPAEIVKFLKKPSRIKAAGRLPSTLLAGGTSAMFH